MMFSLFQNKRFAIDVNLRAWVVGGLFLKGSISLYFGPIGITIRTRKPQVKLV